MRSVTFGCPSCGRGLERYPGQFAPCKYCGAEAGLEDVTPPPCMACGCDELYRHRDFNQKLGILIIAIGVVLWLWLDNFLPMVGAAIIDLLLFYKLPDVAICYRCKAHHRGFDDIGVLPGFDLERHEHYRFLKAKAEAAATDQSAD